MPMTNALQKVVARLELDAWHGHATETLWAERVGEDRYRLRSVPFFARGISVEDVVNTRKEDGLSIIVAVSLHGGHSTYRIFMTNDTTLDSDAFANHWRELAAFGVTYERATESLLAVDVPPNANIHRVYDLLAKGEADGVWEFEEGSVSPDTDVDMVPKT